MTVNLQVDFSRHEVFVDNQKINLTEHEYRIFSALITSKEPLSRESLLDIAWKTRSKERSDLKKVDVAISRLRKKLDILLIETVPHEGYKFSRQGV